MSMSLGQLCQTPATSSGSTGETSFYCRQERRNDGQNLRFLMNDEPGSGRAVTPKCSSQILSSAPTLLSAVICR